MVVGPLAILPLATPYRTSVAYCTHMNSWQSLYQCSTTPRKPHAVTFVAISRGYPPAHNQSLYRVRIVLVVEQELNFTIISSESKMIAELVAHFFGTIPLDGATPHNNY